MQIICFLVLFMLNAASSIGAEEKTLIGEEGFEGIIESYLYAIAINGEAIPPSEHPQAAVGDVITFRVSTFNTESEKLYSLRHETVWGAGFVYRGNLTSSHVECSHDDQTEKISVYINEIDGVTKDNTYSYTFDLQVIACDDVSVSIYSDDTYSCQAIKIYHTAIQLENPEIEYVISSSPLTPSSESAHSFAIEIKNKGNGDASQFFLDTSLEDSGARVTGISSEFNYDSATGIFRLQGNIQPLENITLTFDVSWDDEFSGIVFFSQNYVNSCGIQFYAPQQHINVGTVGNSFFQRNDSNQTINAAVLPVSSEQTDLDVFVTPHCCSIFSDAPITWEIYVTNRGAGAVSGVQLSDIMGPSLRYEISTINGKGCRPSIHRDMPTADNTTIEWNLGNISEKETVKVEVTAQPVGYIGDVSDFINSVNVNWVCGDESCRFVSSSGPCFLLPDRCIYGDFLEREKSYVHGFFSVARIYKSNLYKTKTEPEGLWATYLTPGIWVAVPASHKRIVEIFTSSSTPGGLVVSPFYPRSDRRYQSYFQYTPQFEIYEDRHDENFISHQADAYFRYDSMNKFSVRAMDQFKRTHDSISSRVYTIDDKYKTNLFNTLGTVDLTPKFKLRLDYSNYYVNYDDADNSSSNRQDNSYSGYVYFKFLQKTSLFVEHEFSDIDYDTFDLDSREFRYYGGFRWETTKKSRGQIKGGYGLKQFDRNDLSDVKDWMAEIQIDHDINSRATMVFNAYRRYDEVSYNFDGENGLPEGMAKYILTHSLALSFNYNFTSKIHLGLDGTVFYDEYKPETRQAGEKERHDTEYAISPSIKFIFLKWMTFDISYVYTNRDSNYPEYNFDDHTLQLRGSVFM